MNSDMTFKKVPVNTVSTFGLYIKLKRCNFFIITPFSVIIMGFLSTQGQGVFFLPDLLIRGKCLSLKCKFTLQCPLINLRYK